MAGYTGVIKKESSPKLRSFFDDVRDRRDLDFFRPTGTQVYCGVQGSGKTLSMVYHMHKLKKRYPKSFIVTNLLLTGMKKRTFSLSPEQEGLLRDVSPRAADTARNNQLRSNLAELIASFNPSSEYIFFRDMSELSIALVGVNNGKFGVMYLIDEIHTYFNALDSKNIPMFVFTEISQQRKQRKTIIGSSQLFLRMAKPFREQCDNIIVCNTHMGVITTQRAYDGMSLVQDYDGSLSGQMVKRGWFWHTREIRELYDTYQKVVSGAEQYADAQKIGIVEQPKRGILGKR